MIATNEKRNETPEDKKLFKAQKALEKQKRKEKSLQNAENNVDGVNPISKFTTSKPVHNEVRKNNNTVKEQAKHSQKEKSLQNTENKSKPVDNNQKPKVQRVKSSDRVSFSDSSVKVSSTLINKELTELNITEQESFRLKDKKQVSYFNHLFCPNRQISLEKIISQKPDLKIDPAIEKFGCDLDSFKIRGSTLRCLKFFDALKEMINKLPAENDEYFHKTFSNAFDNSVEFLEKCRPLSVSMRSAIDYLKINISLAGNEIKGPAEIIEMIDQFKKDRIDTAHEGIQNLLLNYVKTDSKILVYSYSEIVYKSILHAWNKIKSEQLCGGGFQVFVVDTFPDFLGGKMMGLLKKEGIPFCQSNLSSIPQIMPRIDLVLLGAHSILPNSNVIGVSGTASIANTARAFSKPVIICAETYKFGVENYFDSFAFNELGNPDFFVEKIIKLGRKTGDNSSYKTVKDWRDSDSNISVLDLLYDVIPGYLISGVICELGFICSSGVSYVSRIKQPY